MGLELKRASNKTLRSKWWYGRYTLNGKRHFINLGVVVRGTPPDNLRKTGDAAVEHSRLTAQVKLDGLIFEARSKKNAEKHLEELYELKSGSAIEQVPLADIEHCWLNLPSRNLSLTDSFNKHLSSDIGPPLHVCVHSFYLPVPKRLGNHVA